MGLTNTRFLTVVMLNEPMYSLEEIRNESVILVTNTLFGNKTRTHLVYDPEIKDVCLKTLTMFMKTGRHSNEKVSIGYYDNVIYTVTVDHLSTQSSRISPTTFGPVLIDKSESDDH